MRLLIILLVLLYTSALDVYYVKPGNSSPSTCVDHQCFTINQFRSMDSSFIEGSTFVFLAGNHSLDTVMKFQNISNVTLKGPGRILLGRTANVSLSGVDNFLIDGIKFVLCSRLCSLLKSALEILASSRVVVSHCEFIGSGNGTLATVRGIYSKQSNVTILNSLFEGNTGLTGGAVAAWKGSKLTVSGSIFTGNSAKSAGGAISVFESMAVLDGTPENVFAKNVAGLFTGMAIECDSCSLTLKGNNTFESNGCSSAVDGGGLSVLNGTLLFESGTTQFLRNEALRGGGITTSINSTVACNSKATVVFKRNKAQTGGGLNLYESNFKGGKCSLHFEDNFAIDSGGAMLIYQRFKDVVDGPLMFSGKFINNRASTGSVIYMRDMLDVIFTNSVFENNSLYLLNSDVTFENCTFSNSRQDIGGSIHSADSSLQFKGHGLFSGNKAIDGGALHLIWGQVAFYGNVLFTHNSAVARGGGIYTFRTVVKLYGTVNFTSNLAQNGGGIYLDGDAYLSVALHSRFHSSYNEARDYGGVLYSVDNANTLQCLDQESAPGDLHCAIKIEEQTIKRSLWSKSVTISSYNDSAGKYGNFLYGGLLDRCYVLSKNDIGNESSIETMFYFLTRSGILTWTPDNIEKQAVTSLPYIMTICASSENFVSSTNKIVYRGQKFVIPLLATAQGSAATSTSVTAKMSSSSSLALLQNPQYLPRYCSNLTYNLYSTMESEELVLYPEGPCHDTGLARVVINVTLLPCPDGTIQQSDRCECEPSLRDYNISCTIDEDFQFTKKAGSVFWMGAEYRDGLYEGLVLYKTCPNGYCSTNEVNMSSLHDLDVQCAPGRVGLLCGSCAENNSLLFGGSKCGQCSNNYLILILAFAAAGIILVVFLSILKLTVATGMLNSLILFANIVQVNRKLFLSTNTVNVLTVFIAWLNFDLGFETCFYDEMDAFVQTCLQFAFPAYVWFLISLIIVTSRYSIIISKMIGHNPIAVLATLLLMSYTKILNIIIEVFSSVKLEYPHGKTSTVWLKDASVPYLQSKHLALAVVTVLVSIFFFLPYTFLLLFGHKLYRFSRVRHLRWINKLKPLLDSYYAPYKIQTRFWTGFLLLVRCALYTVFSFNSLGNTNRSLLAIILTFTALLFAQGILLPGRIYTKFCLNFLEAFSYMNLVVLSAVTLVQVPRKAVIICFLIGVMLTITIGVLAYHIHLLCTAKSNFYLKIRNRIANAARRRLSSSNDETDPLIKREASRDLHQFVSKSDVTVREPLLEDY